MNTKTQAALRWAVRLSWLVLGSALLCTAYLCTTYILTMIGSPFGADIGEGTVLQQANAFGTSSMYGDIGTFPFLACEYPPVYVAVSRAVAAFGMDLLAAGRIVSALSTGAVLLLVAYVVDVGAAGLSRPARFAASSVAALLPLTLLPIILWSSLMRVDMLALALSFAGLAFGLRALRTPAFLYVAMPLFVLSCLTKQTFISAPLAVLAIHGLRDARLALRAAIIGGALGTAAVIVLSVQTNGGFLTHVISYTINTYSAGRAAVTIATWAGAYITVVVLAALAVLLSWRNRQPALGFRNWSRVLGADDRLAWQSILTLYLLLSTLMVITVGKAGASLNYFLEWMSLWCVWVGILIQYLARTRGLLAPMSACVPILLLLHVGPSLSVLQTMRLYRIAPAHVAVERALIQRFAEIKGPIIADDAVSLWRAGRGPSPEMFVLSQLSRTGQWDEHRLINLIDSDWLGAIATQHGPGNVNFDQRYTPGIQAAMAQHYARTEIIGETEIHFASPPLPHP